METWRPQTYRALAPSSLDPEVLENALETASITEAVNHLLPPILTLGHVAHYTGTRHALLRAIVARRVEDPYRVFRIQKRPLGVGRPRFRTICVPEPTLLAVQSWINMHVLRYAAPHPSSTAFGPKCSIRSAAERHCHSQWLIKLDIVSFFESISELRVWRVFASLGYQPIVSLELARLCTRLGSETPRKRRGQWQVRTKGEVITAYGSNRMGHLPQGAPTSPMLANLAMKEFDIRMTELARSNGLEYSRYADDVTLSTADKHFTRDRAIKVIGRTFSVMGEFGLSPNMAKTQISPPGARKVVLGLLVNGPVPRLTREFRQGLRQHLHYLLHPSVGPVRHAEARGFVATATMRNHIGGLIAFAHDIDPAFARACATQFRRVNWPT